MDYSIGGAGQVNGAELQTLNGPQAATVQWVVGSQTIATIPAFMANQVMRLELGTREMNPVTTFLAWSLFNLVNIFAMIMSGARGTKTETIGTVVIYLGFVALTVYHHARAWYLMFNIDKESDSEMPGPPHFIFHEKPGPLHWVLLRCLYEPGLFFGLMTLLGLAGLISPIAAIFYMFSAVCLSFKSYCTWYLAWYHWRIRADNAFRVREIEAVSNAMLKNHSAPLMPGPAIAASVPRETLKLYNQMH